MKSVKMGGTARRDKQTSVADSVPVTGVSVTSGLTPTVRLIVVAFVLCSSLAFPSFSWSQQPAAIKPDSAAYLLVIDHSGSMTAKMPSGKTRWVEMQEKAVDFIRNIPLESQLWIAVFSGNRPQPSIPAFNTEADRQAVIDQIMTGYGPPEGGTLLYDTLEMAFEEAERRSIALPNRHISVLAYTDGQDSGSKISKERLEQRFKQALGNNQNLWFFYTQIGSEGLPLSQFLNDPHAKEGSFKKPLPMSARPGAIGLKNPKVEPKQTFELEFIASDSIWALIKDNTLTFNFVPDGQQKIKVNAVGVPLKKGPLLVTLEVENPKELDSDFEYSGVLKIVYPELKLYEIKAADYVKVTFQKGEKLEIYDRIPANDKEFAAGQPVFFRVSTLKGAKVVWDFGDGSTDSGAELKHTYNTPGKKMVSVSVEADQAIGTKQSFPISIIDVGVSIDPFQGTCVESAPYTFTASGRGPIQRYEWVVDGQKFEETARDPANKSRTQIAYAFDKPGRHVVSVWGYSEKLVVHSEDRAIDVITKPTLQIVRPQIGQLVPFGEANTFLARVNGPVDSVTWVVRKKPKSGEKANDKTDLLNRVACAVVPGQGGAGGGLISEFKYAFAESPDEMDVVLEAIGEVSKEIKLSAPSKNVEIRVVYPSPQPTLETEGVSPFSFGKPIQFKLSSPQELKSIEWDFGDKATDKSNTASPLHLYGATGPFEVKVKVKGKGNHEAVVKQTVNVVCAKPECRPQLLIGGQEFKKAMIGNIVELKNESAGDVIASTWYYDGQPLPASQVTLPLNELGEHRIKLQVSGAPDQNGESPVDEKEVVFRVWQKPNHMLFVGAVLLAIGAFLIACRLLIGNLVSKWKIYFSNVKTPDEAMDPSIKIAPYWSRWRKEAVIPLHRLFGRSCEYWGSGQGAQETITIRPVTQGGSISCSASYTGEGNDLVTVGEPSEDGKRVDYNWRDNRCPDEQYRRFFLRVVKSRDNSHWPKVVLFLLAVVLFGFLWLVYSKVYIQN